VSDDASRRFFVLASLAPFANPPIRVGLADRFSFPRDTLNDIAAQRSLPPIDRTAVAIGLLAAVGSALILGVGAGPGAPIFGIAAPLCGIAIGAFLAGKLAKYAGLYHGALVGAGYVVIEALGIAPAPLEPLEGGIAEGLWIIAGDASLLLVAALLGWIAAPQATPSSSSDKDRGR
jgi:peptidoglycan/LPS O-acetylase OafA/YrhL